MRVVIERDYETMSRRAAGIVAEQVRRKPDSVIGLATGSTPVGMYQHLVRFSHEGLDFSRVVTFNLDEYHGLGPDHPQSYRRFMEEHLFGRLESRPRHIHIPDGMADDPEACCAAYEWAIRQAGGIDIQLLGIGGDGHVGFNEPGSSLGSRTRLVVLTEETIADNSRFFAAREDVPAFALTMGVGTILEARQCLLLASGIKKAKMVALTIEGPVTSLVTASALQLHPDTVAILDEDAADLLELKPYYRHAERACAGLARRGTAPPPAEQRQPVRPAMR